MSNYTRRVNIWINVNGKEVKNDVASVRAEMQKLVNQQARMTIGSQEYVRATKDITKLKTILAEHREELKVTAKGWDGMKNTFGMVAAAAASLAGIGATISAFFNAYREQERAVQKVAQAIESTGNAAGLSLKTLTKEASNLQNNTLFGDEEILNKSTAQLLTFTNVTGEIFLKAQHSALDLATVLDGDLQNSTIMLGKALNDPIRGLTALRRVGVSFTEEQREQIKVLAETNRLEEAQNIILGEMTRQFGGQAEAAAKGSGVWTQVRMQLGEITEAIGGKMSSALIDMGTNFRDLFKSIAEGLSGYSAKDAFDEQVTSVLNLTEKIDPLLDRYDELKSKSKLTKDEQSELKSIIDQVADSVPGAVSAFDEYGKAIGINTTKAREFIGEQVAMMGVLNKSAIEEAKKALKSLEIPLADAKRVRDTMASSGVTEQHGLNTSTRPATQTEIKDSQDKYAELLKQKLGYETLIKNLNGDALKNAVEKREQDAKSAKETENKKTSYKKLSVSTLKKLAEDEDELAIEEIKRRENIKHGTKILADAFKELSKKISDFDAEINNAIASGNSPLVEKLTQEKKAAELLLKSYNEVKAAYASGWDMNQRDQGSIDTLVGFGANVVTSTETHESPLTKRQSDGQTSDPSVHLNLEDTKAKINSIKEESFQLANDLNSAIFTMVTNHQQAEFAQKMNNLDLQKEKELSNINLTAAQKDAVNKKYEAQARKLKAEEFKKQQNAAVVQAVINGALAITKTFATFGWPAGIIPAAFQAAATLTQIAVIKSQEAPQFYEGGYTTTSSNSRRPAGVVHDNEYVVPAEGLKNPFVRSIVNSIEIARLNKSLPTFNPLVNWKQSQQMFAGGFSSQATSKTENPIFIQNSNTGLMSAEEIRVMNEFTLELRKVREEGLRGKWSLYDFEKIQHDKASIQSQSDM